MGDRAPMLGSRGGGPPESDRVAARPGPRFATGRRLRFATACRGGAAPLDPAPPRRARSWPPEGTRPTLPLHSMHPQGACLPAGLHPSGEGCGPASLTGVAGNLPLVAGRCQLPAGGRRSAGTRTPGVDGATQEGGGGANNPGGPTGAGEHPCLGLGASSSRRTLTPWIRARSRTQTHPASTADRSVCLFTCTEQWSAGLDWMSRRVSGGTRRCRRPISDVAGARGQEKGPGDGRCHRPGPEVLGGGGDYFASIPGGVSPSIAPSIPAAGGAGGVGGAGASGTLSASTFTVSSFFSDSSTLLASPQARSTPLS